MESRTNRYKLTLRGAFATAAVFASFINHAAAQLILNEANTVGASSLVQWDTDKPYEGYDYGILPYSGNNNPVNHPTDPGNPFPEDVDAGTGGNQTTLPNGWDGSTGWARILQNGGDWLELVVTEDHTDLRGYTLYWENDDSLSGTPGTSPDDRGFIKLTQHSSWADLRAGTIITLSEDSVAEELRDQYPLGPPFDFGGLPPHSTGYFYDLSTNLAFDPFTANDWHVHYHVDEEFTDVGIATEYFEGYSDIKVDNDEWRMYIFDATNTTLAAEAETPVPPSQLDLTTGLVQSAVGESTPNWAANTGGTGVNNQELVTLVDDPVTGITSADYEDVDFSTFGSPNLFNRATEATLDGVQDFSALRNPVLDKTYHWNANSTADFGAAENWVHYPHDSLVETVPASGPQSDTTVSLVNDVGGSVVAQVSESASVEHVSVSATASTMTLEVQSGATLGVGAVLDVTPSPYDYNQDGRVNAPDYTVYRNTLGSTDDLRADGNGNLEIDPGDYDDWKAHYGETGTTSVVGSPTGRLLVYEGGALLVNGVVAANTVEVFEDGIAFGSGTVDSDLIASGGIVAPGNSTGTLTVTGDYTQHEGSTLAIELAGTSVGEFDVLAITGIASLSGALDISLVDFTPNVDDMFTILTAADVDADLTLTGDSAGFSLLENPTSLVLHFTGDGLGASGQNVPEPTTCSLAALAIFALQFVGMRRKPRPGRGVPHLQSAG